MITFPRSVRLPLACVVLAISTTGCSGLGLPKVDLAKRLGVMGELAAGQPEPSSRFRPVGPVQLASSTLTEPVYNAVQRAKRENAVVLQVIGDDAPIRVLPLPPASGGSPSTTPQSIYVSQLLTETGIQQKLGNVQATLFRAEAGSIGGIQMDVSMDDSTRRIRPETDYALRAGDRLVVARDDTLHFGAVVGLLTGR